MIRILITDQIKAIARGYADNLFVNKDRRFNKPLDNLKNLKFHFQRIGYINHTNYIQKIIDKFDDLLRVEPQSFTSIYSNYFNPLLSDDDLKEKFRYNEKNKSFYEHIVDAMRYDVARDEFLPYVKKLSIRTCVYCNAQFAITVDVNPRDIKGKYELDHFYPKSKYPFLCISFFNMQPCCAHCNKTKNDIKAEFGLYTIDYTKLSPFEFTLDKASLVRYMLTQNSEDLKIVFNSTDRILLRDHLRHFHITELYNIQKDIVEEIVWKSKIYNKFYLESLEESFSRLFTNKADFNRFIIGNYDKPEDIHKRPMAKLTQDIAKQLGLK